MKQILLDLMLFMLKAELAESGREYAQPPAGQRQAPEFSSDVELDVPFVPMPPAIASAMLKAVGITATDVVYDLGCGDGRVVLAAVGEMHACRGVGIDRDPRRIRECLRNARERGLENKVTFLQDDFFTAPIAPATVVVLYLLPGINLRLRPRLLTELRPGTRIATFAFTMGDWKPDYTYTIGGLSRAYCWRVPANVSGRWTCTADGLPGPLRLRVKQRFQLAGGTALFGNRASPLIAARLSGAHVSFSLFLDIDGKNLLTRWEGSAEGDRMEGAVRWNDGGEKETCWQALREPETRGSLSPDTGTGRSIH